jgi:hypothetical protein
VVLCDRTHTRIAHTFVGLLLVMTLSRSIPLFVHGAVETIAAPAIMVAPFLFGFGVVATAVAVAIGALWLSLALSIHGQPRPVPLSAHAGFDYLLAITAIVAGVAVGIATGQPSATVFLVGVGAAMMALTASTRFSVPRGA